MSDLLAHEAWIAYKFVLLSGHNCHTFGPIQIPLIQVIYRLEGLLDQSILLSLCLLFLNIYHAIALPAFPHADLTTLKPPASLGLFVTDCSAAAQVSPAIEAADCFDAIDRFQERVDPGSLQIDVICTYDSGKAHDPSYILLPDSEIFGSCEVAWDIPHRTDVLVSWDGFFWFSRDLVHECVGGNKNGGVIEWGHDWEHIVRFKAWPPDSWGRLEVGNGTMSGRVDVD